MFQSFTIKKEILQAENSSLFKLSYSLKRGKTISEIAQVLNKTKQSISRVLKQELKEDDGDYWKRLRYIRVFNEWNLFLNPTEVLLLGLLLYAFEEKKDITMCMLERILKIERSKLRNSLRKLITKLETVSLEAGIKIKTDNFKELWEVFKRRPAEEWLSTKGLTEVNKKNHPESTKRLILINNKKNKKYNTSYYIFHLLYFLQLLKENIRDFVSEKIPLKDEGKKIFSQNFLKENFSHEILFLITLGGKDMIKRLEDRLKEIREEVKREIKDNMKDKILNRLSSTKLYKLFVMFCDDHRICVSDDIPKWSFNCLKKTIVLMKKYNIDPEEFFQYAYERWAKYEHEFKFKPRFNYRDLIMNSEAILTDIYNERHSSKDVKELFKGAKIIKIGGE